MASSSYSGPTLPLPDEDVAIIRAWDSNSDFHVYQFVEATQRVEVLLNEIDDDPGCIFFG